eukprot:5829540-Amphidinium_carterae.1
MFSLKQKHLSDCYSATSSRTAKPHGSPPARTRKNNVREQTPQDIVRDAAAESKKARILDSLKSFEIRVEAEGRELNLPIESSLIFYFSEMSE